MDPVIVLAMLLAALLHSSWHAMIKVSGDKVISLAGMNVVSSAVGLCVVPFVAVPKAPVFAVLAAAVVLHNAYKLALAQLYRLGDLSIGYPVARGLAPVFAAGIAVVLLDEMPTARQAAGIGLISLGLVGMAGGKGRPSAVMLCLAAVAGLCVAAYSAVDAYGTRMAGDWLGYTAWLVVLDGLAFVLLAQGMRGAVFLRTLKATPWKTVISGALGVASFGVFLWALSRGAVGGVAALRETSVLFVTIIGVVVLKERLTVRRAVAAALVTAGVVALALK